MLRSRAAALGACGATAAAGLFFYRQQQSARVPPGSALQPNTSLACPLLSVEPLSADTSRYRFGLPTPQHVLGLPAASHLLAHDSAMVCRAYTPVTLDKFDKGHFDLIVKRYPNGLFSEAFAGLKLGDTMSFRGPVTTLRYEPNVVKTLGMVCGGTGITPMYQIIRTVLSDPSDTTVLRLVYANKSPSDILLWTELEALAAAHPGRLAVRYVVERASGEGAPAGQLAAGLGSSGVHEAGARGRVAVGRVVGADDLVGFLPGPSEARAAVLVCGPAGMLRHLCGEDPSQRGSVGPRQVGGLLGALGYGKQVVEFSDRNLV